jgi:hypothetical protein
VTSEPGHSDLLPALVSGQLDAASAAEVRHHLAGCGACRREVEALTSMRETMRRHVRTDHVPAIDLVAYAGTDPSLEKGAAAAIEAHLRECLVCSEDFETLRQASLEFRSPDPAEVGARFGRAARPGIHWRRAVLTAAALATILLLILIARPAPREAPGRMVDIARVTFSPATRGGAAGITLSGEGPWAATVVLPFGSTPGVYAVSVQHADGSPVPGLTLRSGSWSEGNLGFLIPALPGAGAYRLKVSRDGSADAEPIDFPFVYSGEQPPIRGSAVEP